jgi:hypothetical protein
MIRVLREVFDFFSRTQMNDSSTQTSFLKSPESFRRNRTEPVLSGLLNQIDLNQVAEQSQTEPVLPGPINQIDLNQITRQNQTGPAQTRRVFERESEPTYLNQIEPVHTINQNGPVIARPSNQRQNGNSQNPNATRMPNQHLNDAKKSAQYQKDPFVTRIPNQRLNEANHFAQENQSEPVQSKKIFPNLAADKDHSGGLEIAFNAVENR